MNKVFKYPLEVTGKQTILIPRHSKILCVENQYDAPVLYVEVDTDNKNVEITIVIVGTGHKIPNVNLEYIGTVMTYTDTLVWHVYREIKHND